MEFKLKKYYYNISKADIIEDLQFVANTLGKDSFTIYEYQENGKYHNYSIRSKFGNWAEALKAAGLNYSRNRVSDNELLNDLKETALKNNLSTLSVNEYSIFGKYHAETLQNRFGGWNNTLKLAGLNINKDKNIPEEALMQNIFEIWQKLGKQPTHRQIKQPISLYSIRPYINIFGTWQKALEKFIEYVNNPKIVDLKINEPVIYHEPIVANITHQQSLKSETLKYHKTARTVNWRLRFLVFKRDNFKCVMCGRSPAKNPEIELHVDHIQAWSKGGQTLLENLQTLCSVCNIGKSNLE